MATCQITSTFSNIGCNDAVGGIKAVAFAAFSGGTVFTLDGSNIITSAASASTFYQYVLPPFTGNFKDSNSTNTDRQSGKSTQTLVINLNKLSATLRNNILTLRGLRSRVMVEFYSGDILMMGYANGATMTTAEFDSGTKLEDGNFWAATFVADEINPAYHVSGSVYTSLTVTA